MRKNILLCVFLSLIMFLASCGAYDDLDATEIITQEIVIVKSGPDLPDALPPLYDETTDNNISEAVTTNTATNTTNYTWDEINNSQGYLVGLGEDKDPFSVVGKYNEDFSEIVITKNTNKDTASMRSFSRIPLDTAKGSNLVSVVIKDGVSSVGYGAFVDCLNLELVVLPESITVIDDFAFCGCASLKEIVIPHNVSYIGAQAFSATSITSINIPSSVIELGPDAFLECSDLTTINFESAEVPQWFDEGDVPNVTIRYNVPMP